ncbi:hypothetical protein AG1IA_04962 [Rhizoctonia solani AG-1 IA]|uniref:Uncharacterized protein n=1 Tax=Thanatephorus cucumeris (strain AG1-IA) TaxID=983506 RepID=L8WW42_THACA|nr:hypothetical protein AG1IA_04962 [Rhizoctonia solani AG-1 IA]
MFHSSQGLLDVPPRAQQGGLYHYSERRIHTLGDQVVPRSLKSMGCCFRVHECGGRSNLSLKWKQGNSSRDSMIDECIWRQNSADNSDVGDPTDFASKCLLLRRQ